MGQADAPPGLSPAITAPPPTSAAPATFRPAVVIAGAMTRVLVEQLRAVDLDRLGEEVGRLAAHEQRAVDEALELVLGL